MNSKIVRGSLGALSALVLASLASPALGARASEFGGVRTYGQDWLPRTAPYPTNRVDDPRREQNGRLWVARSPVGTRTPIRESVFGQPGPAAYGAPISALGTEIYVQRAPMLPVETVSPWVNLDSQTRRWSLNDRPRIQRSARLVDELRLQQNAWLSEQGYILKVRTHVNPVAQARATGHAEAGAGSGGAKDIKPRAIIRVRDRFAKPPEVEASAENRSE